MVEFASEAGRTVTFFFFLKGPLITDTADMFK